eukprot:COSAG04_NODE_4447_length_2086_cov_6.825629_2_plen_53_part_00
MMRAALLLAAVAQSSGAALVDVEQVRSRLPSLLRRQRNRLCAPHARAALRTF